MMQIVHVWSSNTVYMAEIGYVLMVRTNAIVDDDWVSYTASTPSKDAEILYVPVSTLPYL